jgi:Transposase
MFVAVHVDRDPQPVRRFTTFTNDLVALADWLKQCGITSVAMESTGVFWIPLFQLLEDRGFRVCLVNARHAKNVPGRKTDSRIVSGYSICIPSASYAHPIDRRRVFVPSVLCGGIEKALSR